MLTVFVLLAIIALILTVANATGHVPLWVAVVFLCVIELLRALPLGR